VTADPDEGYTGPAVLLAAGRELPVTAALSVSGQHVSGQPVSNPPDLPGSG
jgi:hypothetical protein